MAQSPSRALYRPPPDAPCQIRMTSDLQTVMQSLLWHPDRRLQVAGSQYADMTLPQMVGVLRRPARLSSRSSPDALPSMSSHTGIGQNDVTSVFHATN